MRRIIVTVAVAACLALVGCDITGDDEPEPDPPSAAASFDPCELIPREDIEELGLYREAAGEQFVGLSLGREQIVDCRVDHYESFSFGYKGVEDGREVWQLVSRVPPEEESGVEQVEDLGDEAYFDGYGFSRTLAIRVGDQQFFIRDDTEVELEHEEFIGLGRTLVENAPDQIEHAAIVLPEECPDADGAAVTNLVGEVVQARGAVGEYGSLSRMCRYLSDGGTRIIAETVELTPENAAELIEHRAEDAEEFETDGHTVYREARFDSDVLLSSANSEGTFVTLNVTASVDGEDEVVDPEGDVALELMTELLANIDP